MNNFYDTYYQNYYNVNDITNMAEQQGVQQDLTTPEDGFKKGNIFKKLYWPYLKDTFVFTPRNEREKMLLKIMQDDFYAHELKLYLDTHPEDVNKINMYGQYGQMIENEMSQYNSKYAPLTLQGINLNSPWTWEDSPWPWEGV